MTLTAEQLAARRHTDTVHVCPHCNGEYRGNAIVTHARKCTTSSYKRREGRGAHTVVAERVLGKPLPHGAIVHHVDHNPANNAPSNLVICPDKAYHNLIHQREIALDACGHADWRQCMYCHAYDDPANMRTYPSARGYRHMDCARRYKLALRRKAA